jgi:hypothetical protein
MASKKAGRLAGLAALAGLAYMANKKGEGKTPDAGKSETKETPAPARDDSKKVIESRVRKDDDITVAGEGGFDAPADMSRVSRVGTPARTASSVKAPSASVAKAPASSTAMPEGAFRGIRSETKPVGAYRGTRSDSQATKDAEQAKLTSSYKPRRPDVKLRDTRFTYNNDPNDQALYANKALRQRGAEERPESEEQEIFGKKRGGVIKKMASGGMASSASKRADGIASKGKTRGRMC